MKKIFVLLCIFCSLLWSKTDFSEMSTEELIALIGYIDQSKEERLFEELDTRVGQMSEGQKALYEDEKKRRENAQK